ncbi:MAG TPA: hypothetical protein VEB19_13340 [Gemmatimonadaceae bacterium]|nr:hypothetical protein [Gemmatimonadaceae bacterium]
MIYETHLAATEAAFWPMDSIAWDNIDREAARAEGSIHQALHDAALIEGYLPVYAARLLQLLWEDVDATAVFSMELFEGLRHYTMLRRYLDLVGFRSATDVDASLAVARGRARSAEYSAERIGEHLTHFMGSELFASYFFLRIAEQSREPVLQSLLRRMSADERRHATAAAAVLEQRVRRDGSIAAQVRAAANAFQHYGSDVVHVPVGEANDFEALAAFNRKVRDILASPT